MSLWHEGHAKNLYYMKHNSLSPLVWLWLFLCVRVLITLLHVVITLFGWGLHRDRHESYSGRKVISNVQRTRLIQQCISNVKQYFWSVTFYSVGYWLSLCLPSFLLHIHIILNEVLFFLFVFVWHGLFSVDFVNIVLSPSVLL